jgi:DNA-binding SARP family transcriptional activator
MGLQLAQEANSYHSLLMACRGSTDFLIDTRVPKDLKLQASKLATCIKEFREKIPDYRRAIRKQKLVISIEKTPRISIQTLGEIKVSLDGEPVIVPEWRAQSAVRELFFLLLGNPDGLSKEEIGVILWADSSTQELKIQFKNTIYRLRRALGKDVVLFDNNSDIYKFNFSLDYEYDVEKFRIQIKDAEMVSGLEQISAYEKAVKIYQGPYLPNGDGVWIVPEREELWRMFLRAKIVLAEHALDNGEFNASLAHIHHILTQDKCQEEAHRLAMRIHAAMGNQADLIRQYESCKSALLTDYAITPSKTTEDLYIQLLSN